MQTKNSNALFQKAKEILVGGVDSPVRAFKAVGGDPIFMKEGTGAYLISEDSEKYIDYVLSWGPMILGHAPCNVIKAIQKAAEIGTSFGTPSKLETELGKMIQSFYPSCQKIRFVNSGTEAAMSAIRLARGYTNRELIIKFNGCYHGHVDSLLVSAGSGALTFGNPDSAGVLPGFVEKTRILEFNDIDGLKNIFQKEGKNIAGVILEPVCGNMGVILPEPGFLETLRELCTKHESLLIFDEVMTGFRIDLGGAQKYFNISPDLTLLGKVIGGGLPCGAYGGKAEIMDCLSPTGNVYQAGTLSGNPIAMTAGIETLKELQNTDAFNTARNSTAALVAGFKQVLKKKNLNYKINHLGTMFSIFFTEHNITNLPSAKTANAEKFKHYYHSMLAQGIYLAPSQFEANFLSSVHSEDDISDTIAAFEKLI